MLPTWEDSYSINNESIDAQHKKLFELAAVAYNLENKYVSKQQIKDVLNGFFEYMKTHFSDEEEYMLSIGYPKLDEHKKIHNYIIQSMVRLISKIHNTNDMKEQLGVIAKKWLLEHILQEDMKIESWRRKSILKAEKEPEARKPKEKFYYVCSCKSHFVTAEIHEKIKCGAKFICKKCGEVIVYMPNKN
ncbi:bacteriohemerythrin [Campylobacter sp. RM12327]|uniref:hemerythrin family protein n=1 Tax=Campylobacter sputorum TaxID=206 RepID=UPI000B774842|nr:MULTISPECIES: hemerythrin family protein [Campylobacter]ASM40592.1 hemerythrin-like metal-binding domain protein [Campylobacter sputorum]MBE7357743.1 bacteriohemerythrin [Campylobacter sp. RM11302]MBF6669021.1 bacteriohemerythrin [Campylobacter sp. RM12327]MBF6673970.1 bacteriohemerythrin [Campylobacter sp. RM13538]MBF6675873.1 bacteriohemerythrin [Campylobacter sp. RM12321]